jgi:predicted phosphodiesterase
VKRAIISDIHSNLEGFEAVLADVEQQGITEVYCLGDIIGYGPNPRECIDLAMKCNICLLGNHDQAALFDPEGFNTGAERAIFWTRDQLEKPGEDPEVQAKRWDFLGELPRNHREDGLLYVHGSPRNPLNEYVFPEDIYNKRKMEKIFSLVERFCFQGHTHVPGVFTESLQFFSPEEINTRRRSWIIFWATGFARGDEI